MQHPFMKYGRAICYAIGIVISIGCDTRAMAELPAAFNRGFIENKGQLHDQNGLEYAGVKFVFHSGPFKMLIRENGWSYELTGHPRQNPVVAEAAANGFPMVHASRVDVRLSHSNPHPRISVLDASCHVYHFYTGGRPAISGVRDYAAVILHDVYPRVDLKLQVLSSSPARLEYSFIVHPGARPESIRLIYEGSFLPLLQGDQIRLLTRLGEVAESAPVFIDGLTGEAVKGAFVLEGNVLHFSNPLRETVDHYLIDPVIHYSTYFGGDTVELGEDLQIDHEGNVVVTGRTGSQANIATSGAYDVTYGGGGYDIFLLKFNADYELQWCTYFGGSRVDYAWALTLDAKGNIYLAGEAYSSGLATDGAEQKTVEGQESDGLLSKFDPNGNLVWSRYFGGAEKDQFLGIELDKKGRLVTTGYTLSSDSIATPGSHLPAYAGNGDVFLSVFDTAQGNVIWSTYYGAEKDDRGHDVAIDAFNNIYFSGTALSKTGIATPGTYQSKVGKQLDAFLAKFTETGELIWGTYIAGDKEERGRDVVVDLDNNIYVTGFTQSDTGFASPGGFKTYRSPGIDSTGYHTLDAFLTKFDPQGQLIWGTYFGDSLTETPRGIVINQNNEVLIAGATFSFQGIAYGNAYKNHLSGTSDLFFSKFSSDGKLIWSSYFGGSGEEQVGGYGQIIRTDNQNRIYLLGATTSTDSIATPDAYQGNNNGEYDAYIAVFDDQCFDGYEPNDDFDKASLVIAAADTMVWGYYGEVQNALDEDYYRLHLNTFNQKLVIKLEDLAANYDVYLYDSLQNLYAFSANFGQVSEYLTAGISTSGTYYVKVAGADLNQWNDSLCYRMLIWLDSNLYDGAGENRIPYSSVQVYPNPASGQVILEIAVAAGGTAAWSLWSLEGKQVLMQTVDLNPGINRFPLNVSEMNPGIYFFRVENAAGVSISPVMME